MKFRLRRFFRRPRPETRTTGGPSKVPRRSIRSSIIRQHFDPHLGLLPFQARAVASGLELRAKTARQAQKLIIVAVQDGRIDTIYRARALFADMTAQARLLPMFMELGVEDYFTFFDLCKMLGFEQITISNGRDFAHQVLIR